MKRLVFGVCAALAAIVGVRLHGQGPTIRAIEINQAIGVQKNNALRFVAGKDTVVRALMTGAVTVDPAQTSATVTRDGVVVTTLSPDVSRATTDIVDFQCPNRATCGNWAAGSYVFDVTVNGSRSSTAGTAYVFQERGRLRILAMPVKANYNGTVLSVSGDSWKNTWQFTRNTYPVAADRVSWILREEFDASDISFNLETDAGQRKLWEALKDLMPAHCLANANADGCFEKIIGFTPTNHGGFPNGTGQGYTYGKPANVVVASDQDAAATVAHEIAHVFAIGDTYNGGSFNCAVNPAPAIFTGKDWDDSSKSVQCTAAGRLALPGVGGTLIPATHHPYEVGGRGPLGDSAEYMGSGGQQSQFWTTQDAYDRLFEKLVPQPASASPAVSAYAASAPVATQRLIEFKGTIKLNPQSAGDVVLTPWESILDDDPAPDTTGTLMVAAVNAAGQRLATQALTLESDLPGGKGEPPVHIDPAPFTGMMRFPQGTTKFQILNGANVLRERAVSANAPVVSNVSLGTGSVFNSPTTIRWTGSDADGDALAYVVEYNPDVTNPHGDFEPLAAFITGAQWTEDFSRVAGGDHARIRVTATDGVNATHTDSAEFRVPFKAPDVAILPITQRALGEVALHAAVEDLQDGELPDGSIVWISQKMGLIGTGELVTAKNLPTGTDVFTVIATNSGGLQTSQSVTVNVVNTSPAMAFDSPLNGSTRKGTVTISGWAADLGATSGTGVDAVHVYAYPITSTGFGSPVFVGAATYGSSRSDVGLALGSQFANSGFSVNGSLAVGSYRLVASARSTVSGTFNNSRTADITITGSSSNPQMALDLPPDGAIFSEPIAGRGWALDLGAANGTGVDAVHVWAFRVSDGAPFFVAAATLGFARNDIAAFFGSQFTNAGYSFVVQGLAPGVYDLNAYARSTVTGTFNQVKAARVTVR